MVPAPELVELVAPERAGLAPAGLGLEARALGRAEPGLEAAQVEHPETGHSEAGSALAVPGSSAVEKMALEQTALAVSGAAAPVRSVMKPEREASGLAASGLAACGQMGSGLAGWAESLASTVVPGPRAAVFRRSALAHQALVALAAAVARSPAPAQRAVAALLGFPRRAHSLRKLRRNPSQLLVRPFKRRRTPHSPSANDLRRKHVYAFGFPRVVPMDHLCVVSSLLPLWQPSLD